MINHKNLKSQRKKKWKNLINKMITKFKNRNHFSLCIKLTLVTITNRVPFWPVDSHIISAKINVGQSCTYSLHLYIFLLRVRIQWITSILIELSYIDSFTCYFSLQCGFVSLLICYDAQFLRKRHNSQKSQWMTEWIYLSRIFSMWEDN